MKLSLFAILISAALFGCTQKPLEKNYAAKAFAITDDFNVFPPSKQDAFHIIRTDSGETKDDDRFSVKFKDTTIAIEDNKKTLGSKLSLAKFINTQKTALLVQLPSSANAKGAFYIISLKEGKPEVTSLARPSNGKQDQKFTSGLEELTLTSIMMVNNDFIITTVNSRIFPIKRQNENERIQGKFYMLSEDRNTIVFLTESALYQVNYMTGETLNIQLPSKILVNREKLNQEIQQNYTWQKNSKGTLFLKDADNDRIVDISEFKH